MERLGRLRTAQQHLDRLSRLFETWSRELLADKNGAIAAAERSEQLAREVMANRPQGGGADGGTPQWGDTNVADANGTGWGAPSPARVRRRAARSRVVSVTRG